MILAAAADYSYATDDDAASTSAKSGTLNFAV